MTAKNNDYYHLGLTDSEVLESREKWCKSINTS